MHACMCMYVRIYTYIYMGCVVFPLLVCYKPELRQVCDLRPSL